MSPLPHQHPVHVCVLMCSSSPPRSELYTHAYLFRTTLTPRERRKLAVEMDDYPSPPGSTVFPRPRWVPSLPSFGGSSDSEDDVADADVERDGEATGVDGTRLERRESGVGSVSSVKSEEEIEVPQLTSIQAVAMLLLTTALTGVTAVSPCPSSSATSIV